MTTLVLIAAILTGPAPEATGKLRIVIHLGVDHRSRVIQSELTSRHEWFLDRRRPIEEHYQIVTDDRARLEPSYEIGHSNERLPFPPGAFAASGSFIRTLAYIAAMDRWERANPNFVVVPAKNEDGWTTSYTLERDESDKPEVFPRPVQPETSR